MGVPGSSGSAFATAVAAPVPVSTMLSAAEHPRRSRDESIDQVLFLVNDCSVST